MSSERIIKDTKFQGWHKPRQRNSAEPARADRHDRVSLETSMSMSVHSCSRTPTHEDNLIIPIPRQQGNYQQSDVRKQGHYLARGF